MHNIYFIVKLKDIGQNGRCKGENVFCRLRMDILGVRIGFLSLRMHPVAMEWMKLMLKWTYLDSKSTKRVLEWTQGTQNAHISTKNGLYTGNFRHRTTSVRNILIHVM